MTTSPKTTQKLSFGEPIAFYVPGSFYIKMNEATVYHTENGGEINQEDSRVFLHEYAHLVQDLSSLYGVCQFMQAVESLPSLISLYDSGGSSVPVPLRTLVEQGRSKATGAECMQAQLEEMGNYIAPRNFWDPVTDYTFLGHRIEQVEVNYLTHLGACKRNTLAFPVVRYEQVDNGMPLEVRFGAVEVYEGFSLAVEEVHGLRRSIEQCFMYRAAATIIKAFLGDTSPRMTMAICHWALQSTTPGVLFFQLLEALKARPQKEQDSVEAVFDFCRTYLFANGYESLRAKMLDALNKMCMDQAAGNPKEHLGKILRWYYQTVERTLRINDGQGRRFPLDTILGDKGIQWAVGIKRLLSEVPVPHLEDKTGKRYSFGAEDEAEQYVYFLRALAEMVNYLWTGSGVTWACPVEPQCQLASKGDACRSSPWLLGQDKELCPYGAAAKYLKIHKRIMACAAP